MYIFEFVVFVCILIAIHWDNYGMIIWDDNMSDSRITDSSEQYSTDLKCNKHNNC